MGESAKHMELVAKARQEAAAIVTDERAAMIQVDSPETTEKPRVGSYCPDVYYNYDDQLVIGEAKTLDDFARKHSQEQFAEYLAACAAFPGESVLIVAVPWMLSATAKNYFRRHAAERGNARVVVIDDTMGRWEV